MAAPFRPFALGNPLRGLIDRVRGSGADSEPAPEPLAFYSSYVEENGQTIGGSHVEAQGEREARFLARGASRPDLGQVARNDPSWLGGWPTMAYNPADLVGRQGIGIFDRMRRDDQVKAAMSFKRDAMLSVGWEVVSPEGQPEDWEVTGFVRRRLEGIEGSLTRSLREMLSAMIYGYSVAEKVYEQIEGGEDDGLVGIKALRPLRPHDYSFNLDSFGRIREDNGIVCTFDPGKTFPRAKFVVYSYQAEWGNPFGESDLESAHRSYTLLHNSYKWLGTLLERHGIPPVAMFYDPNAIKGAQITRLESILDGFRNGASLLIPRPLKESLELWTPQLAGQVATVFIPAQQHFKQDIARALLMPGYLGVTPDAAGSYARAKVTLEMFLLHVAFIQSCLAEEVVADQMIRPMVDINFVTNGAYPIFRFKAMTEETKEQIVSKWRELVEGGMVQHGPEDENYLRSAMGFAQREVKPDEQETRHIPLTFVDKIARALKVGEVRRFLRLEGSDRDQEWIEPDAPEPPPARGIGDNGGPPLDPNDTGGEGGQDGQGGRTGEREQDPGAERKEGDEQEREERQAQLASAEPGGSQPEPIAGPIFAALKVEPTSAEALAAWATENGLTNVVPPSEMHCTTVYSRTPVPTYTADEYASETILPETMSLERLGDDGAVVLQFESWYATYRHEEAERLGASWGYPTYRPHVTLSYDHKGELPVEPPTFAIMLGGEFIKPLDLGEEKVREQAEEAASDIPDPEPPPRDDPSLTVAERRVDFAQVVERLDGLDRQGVRMVSIAARKAVQAKLSELERRPPTLAGVGKVKLELPPAVTAAYVKSMTALYRQGAADCRTEARQAQEFDVALPTFVPEAAIAWLRAKATLFISGLVEKFTDIARNEILEGLRYGRPFRETSGRILEALSPWVGSPGLDPQALRADRMLTVVRTQSTAAYNQGRIVEARRLSGRGLVKGMQYSAVLDRVTTPICRHLHGKQFRIDDPVLDNFTPPNHYRCRSILLPITLDMELEPISSRDLGEANALAPEQFGGRAE
ncbi:MAG: Glittering 9 [Microvirga sp.]|nr:Glittering 9 [Microvirga sp.]